jgi:hypothetical protein
MRGRFVMEVQTRQLRRHLVTRALPLTVKTETALVYHDRLPPSRDTGKMIGILLKGADLRIQTDDPVAQRELEAMNTPTDLEESREGSMSITRMITQIVNAAPSYPMTI